MPPPAEEPDPTTAPLPPEPTTLVDTERDDTVRSTVKSLRKLLTGGIRICDPLKTGSASSASAYEPDNDEKQGDGYDLYLSEHQPTDSPQQQQQQGATSESEADAIPSGCGGSSDNPPPLVEDIGASSSIMPSEETSPTSVDTMEGTKKVLFPGGECEDKDNDEDEEPVCDETETSPSSEAPLKKHKHNDESDDPVTKDTARQQQQRRLHGPFPGWTRIMMSITALAILAVGATLFVPQTTNAKGINEFLDRIRRYPLATYLLEEANALRGASASVASGEHDDIKNDRGESDGSVDSSTGDEQQAQNTNTTAWLETMYEDAEDILQVTYDRTQSYLREAVGEILESLGHRKNQVLERIYEHQEIIQHAHEKTSDEQPESQLLAVLTKYYSDLVDIRNATVALELFLQSFGGNSNGNSTWGEQIRGIHNGGSSVYGGLADSIQKTLELVCGTETLQRAQDTWTNSLAKRVLNTHVLDEDAKVYQKFSEIGDTMAKFYEESGLKDYLARLEKTLEATIGPENMTVIDEAKTQLLEKIGAYYTSSPLAEYLRLRPPPVLEGDRDIVVVATTKDSSHDNDNNGNDDSVTEECTEEEERLESNKEEESIEAAGGELPTNAAAHPESMDSTESIAVPNDAEIADAELELDESLEADNGPEIPVDEETAMDQTGEPLVDVSTDLPALNNIPETSSSSDQSEDNVIIELEPLPDEPEPLTDEQESTVIYQTGEPLVDESTDLPALDNTPKTTGDQSEDEKIIEQEPLPDEAKTLTDEQESAVIDQTEPFVNASTDLPALDNIPETSSSSNQSDDDKIIEQEPLQDEVEPLTDEHESMVGTDSLPSDDQKPFYETSAKEESVEDHKGGLHNPEALPTLNENDDEPTALDGHSEKIGSESADEDIATQESDYTVVRDSSTSEDEKSPDEKSTEEQFAEGNIDELYELHDVQTPDQTNEEPENALDQYANRDSLTEEQDRFDQKGDEDSTGTRDSIPVVDEKEALDGMYTEGEDVNERVDEFHEQEYLESSDGHVGNPAVLDNDSEAITQKPLDKKNIEQESQELLIEEQDKSDPEGDYDSITSDDQQPLEESRAEEEVVEESVDEPDGKEIIDEAPLSFESDEIVDGDQKSLIQPHGEHSIDSESVEESEVVSSLSDSDSPPNVPEPNFNEIKVENPMNTAVTDLSVEGIDGAMPEDGSSNLQTEQKGKSAPPAREIPNTIPDMIRGIESIVAKDQLVSDTDLEIPPLDLMIQEIESIVRRVEGNTGGGSTHNNDEATTLTAPKLSARHRWNSRRGWMQRKQQSKTEQ